MLMSDMDAMKAQKSPPLLPEIAGAAIVEPSDPGLKAALDHAFEEPATPPFRRTRAVVVVHDGGVIAERYADGIGVETQLPGFSMTKSVVNALIGIRNVTLEFDGAGTLQGSSYMLASARDWARFGLLYLNDGLIGGRRLLHEDWVDLSAAATLGTDYGAGFWTNRSGHEHAKGRV